MSRGLYGQRGNCLVRQERQHGITPGNLSQGTHPCSGGYSGQGNALYTLITPQTHQFDSSSHYHSQSPGRGSFGNIHPVSGGRYRAVRSTNDFQTTVVLGSMLFLLSIFIGVFTMTPVGREISRDRLPCLFGCSALPPAKPWGTLNELKWFVNIAAKKHNVPSDLLLAMIEVESRFKSNARSHRGAMGLMQIMPATAKALEISDPYDPAQNIDGGAKYVKQLLIRYKGKKELALAAYNAGPRHVDRHRGIPPFKETRNYVKTVMAKYHANRRLTS